MVHEIFVPSIQLGDLLSVFLDGKARASRKRTDINVIGAGEG